MILIIQAVIQVVVGVIALEGVIHSAILIEAIALVMIDVSMVKTAIVIVIICLIVLV
jgi:hypothetical protein